jgi:cation transporter-like permease
MPENKRISGSDQGKIAVGALVAWVALGVAGYFIGHALGSGNRLAAGVVGIVFANGVWVILCWAFALTLRAALVRRGYDVNRRRK